MLPKPIIIAIGIAMLAAGGTAAFYWSTKKTLEERTYTKADRLESLVKASTSTLVVFRTGKAKPPADVQLSRKLCEQAIKAWAAYAERCGESRATMSAIATRVLQCANLQRAYVTQNVKSCLDFLNKGSCAVLSYGPGELALSLPELLVLGEKAKGGETVKPQPQRVCFGVF